MKLVLEVPEAFKEELEQDSDFDFNLFGDSPLFQVLKDIHTIAIMADRGKDGLVFEARADFAQKSSAADAAKGLEAALTLVRLSLAEGLGDPLRRVRVSADGTRLTVRSEATFEEIKEALEGLEGALSALSSGSAFVEEGVRVVPIPREVTRVPVPVPAVPRPGSPRFTVIANYEVLPDDPPPELLNAVTQRISSLLMATGQSVGTRFEKGVFAVEIRDVFDLEQALVLLTGLASDRRLPVRLELIDVRAERLEAEGVQAVPTEGARPQAVPVEGTPAPFAEVAVAPTPTVARGLEVPREVTRVPEVRREVTPVPVPVPAVEKLKEVVKEITREVKVTPAPAVREATPAPAVREATPAPVAVPAAPRPGTPRFLVVALPGAGG